MSEEAVVESSTEVEPTIADALNDAFDQDEAQRAAEAPAEGGREGRDALGRFAPKNRAEASPETAPAAPEAPPMAPASPDAAQTPAEPSAAPAEARLTHAPQSWKPEERQHWEAIPPAAREAVARREAEVTRALHESAEARRGIDAMRATIAPYLPNIQAANGGDVIGSIKTFFDYDNRLRHGSQIEKARAVTALIKSYGVDIMALDSELAGAPHDPRSQQQDAVQAALQRELAPMRAYMEQLAAREREREQMAVTTVTTQVNDGIQQFAAQPENKYFQSVRNQMADLLDLAGMQNRTITLKEAYETACWQNPQVRAMILQEQQAAAAANRTHQAQRARHAAVSVTGAPRTGPAPAGAAVGRDDRGADIRAAWDAATGVE